MSLYTRHADNVISPNTFRPRINKLDSQLDQEQKASGNYVSGPASIGNHAYTNQFFLENES